MPRVLIVDDEPDICELVSMSIGGAGYITDTVLTSKAAIKKLKENHYDLVFTDIRLPDGDGIDLLSYVQKNFPRLPVCIMTAHGNMDMAVRALRLGAFDFVQKPFDMKQMRQICKNAIGNAAPAESAPAKGAPARAGGKSGGKYQIIGDSPAMVSLRQMIERIAKSLAPVFIHGESGTGKEVAARSIHQLSARANAPFIAVNCGAIPETLVESEFFGYKKGAFTGANADQKGLFVSANGGTLFLDEVADLPLAMQVKLLRAIQERAVRPIGGDREEAVDVRIISATHKNLAECVQRGTFREDLYYRLNVINLTIPSLRQRPEDIPQLAEYLLKNLAQNSAYPDARLTPEALEKLKAYRFPGNVRELENILERALTFANSAEIGPNDIMVRKEEAPAPNPARTLSGRDEMVLDEYMQNMERQLVLQALKDNNQELEAAAQQLGLTPRALQHKMSKLGL